MTKDDLVIALSEMDYCKNQASVVINDIFRIIAKTLLKGEKVMIRGFGTFEVKTRKGHVIQDARTKERVMTKDFQVVTFQPSKNLKEALKTGDPFSISVLAGTEQKE